MRRRHSVTIAPRLANGEAREKLYGRLPAPVKKGLREIAATEEKSMSWVIEQVIIRFFKLDKPAYVPRRKK